LVENDDDDDEVEDEEDASIDPSETQEVIFLLS